jgi:hypothetical protein
MRPGDDVDGDTIHRFTFMTMMRMLLGKGILGMRMFGWWGCWIREVLD